MLSIPSGDQIIRMSFIYYKREGRKLFFKNEYTSFEFVFRGKRLYDFVDQYDIGDEVRFFEEEG